MDATSTMVREIERVGTSSSLRRRQRMPITLAILFVVAVLAAGAIYQPWVNTPFEIVDFSEFLPFLRQSDTFAQRLADFLNYYSGQGRLNLLSYAFLIWKWSLFGWNEAGWQIARSLEMLCIVAGVYILLRRLGATRSGSAAGGALFIVTHTASPAWIRLTMGEPPGLLAIVCAALLATRYQGTRRWRGAGVAIAAFLTASLLAKEMLVALVPFVLLLACSQNASGQFERPRVTTRNVWLASLASAGVLAVLIPVAIVALNAGPRAYASGYAAHSMSLEGLIHSLSILLLPAPAASFAPATIASNWADLVFFVIVALGLGLAHKSHALRRHFQPLALGALSLAVAGALVYLPWPYFQAFYGLPFLLGPAILLAVAITLIEELRPSWRWLVYAGCATMLAQGGIHAAHESRSAIAARMVNRSMVEDIAQHPGVDSVVVIMRSHPPAAQAWQGRGPTLYRYARAVLPGRHIPSIFEADCSAAAKLLGGGIGNTILVSYSTACGTLPASDRTARYDYTYLDWPTLIPRPDSFVVSIVGPDGE